MVLWEYFWTSTFSQTSSTGLQVLKFHRTIKWHLRSIHNQETRSKISSAWFQYSFSDHHHLYHHKYFHHHRYGCHNYYQHNCNDYWILQSLVLFSSFSSWSSLSTSEITFGISSGIFSLWEWSFLHPNPQKAIYWQEIYKIIEFQNLWCKVNIGCR